MRFYALLRSRPLPKKARKKTRDIFLAFFGRGLEVVIALSSTPTP
jgi:hypothetical protein